jgi:hypothetical protein
MLHKDTVDPATLELLISLQGKPYLDEFYLVEGTALSLYLGHRKSIDIDLFSNAGFDTSKLIENLQQDFEFEIFSTAINTLKGSINQTKIDFIAHRYPNIYDPLQIDNISLLSIQDILAMKLNAIATSGQRSKDFIDIYFALHEFDLDNMLDFYKRKYKQSNVVHVLKNLIWFGDVDLSDWPVLILEPDLNWKKVTSKLEAVVFEKARRTNR